MDRNASNEFPFFYLNFGLDFFFYLQSTTLEFLLRYTDKATCSDD